MFENLHNYLYHLEPTGGIPLKGTGIVLGLALLAVHLWALLNGGKAKAFLKDFPRNYRWGAILLTIDFAGAMLCLAYIDMGEFFHLRGWFMTLVPIGFVAVLVYVKEFLAVRALGSLMLLAAGPVLSAAFLQPQLSRLLLPMLAYVWIIVGMFFVGMPFLMRDWITWVSEKDGRWKLAVGSGVLYGAALLLAALVAY